MKIKAKRQFQQPSDAWHLAVIGDVVGVGLKQTRFGPKEKLRVVNFLDERDTSGRPIELWSYYSVSVWPTSRFYGLIRTTMGDDPKLDALGEFDCDNLRGRQYWIKTEQRITPKGTFTNVVGMKPALPNDPRIAIPLDYGQQVQTTNKPNGGLTPPGAADRAIEFPGD